MSTRATAQRAVRLVLVILLVTIFTSLMLQLVPGDAAQLIAGEGATPEVLAAVRAANGLDQNVVTQYLHWMGNLLTGDLGESFRTRGPVWDAIVERAPATIEIAVGAIVIALVVAVPLALFCAYRAGGLVDRTVEGLTSLLVALPPFLTGVLLAFVFSISLRWLPVTGWVPFTEAPVRNLSYVVIPAVALALPALATFQRVLRSDVIATLQQDHIALARAKGVPPRQIMTRHALRPSSFSLLTVAGLQLAQMVGGTVVIETLFGIPGLGALLIQSVLGHDLVMVQGVVVVIALGYLVINLIVDVSYRLLDPRVSV
jgi:peptide/nickel transport system permease protein